MDMEEQSSKTEEKEEVWDSYWSTRTIQFGPDKVVDLPNLIECQSVQIQWLPGNWIQSLIFASLGTTNGGLELLLLIQLLQNVDLSLALTVLEVAIRLKPAMALVQDFKHFLLEAHLGRVLINGLTLQEPWLNWLPTTKLQITTQTKPPFTNSTNCTNLEPQIWSQPQWLLLLPF